MRFEKYISFTINLAFAVGAKSLIYTSATFRASAVYFPFNTEISVIELENSSLFYNFPNLFGSFCTPQYDLTYPRLSSIWDASLIAAD